MLAPSATPAYAESRGWEAVWVKRPSVMECKCASPAAGCRGVRRLLPLRSASAGAASFLLNRTAFCFVNRVVTSICRDSFTFIPGGRLMTLAEAIELRDLALCDSSSADLDPKRLATRYVAILSGSSSVTETVEVRPETSPTEGIERDRP